MEKKNKCACYVRVSTENQLENYSIDEQISRLKAYCKAKDYVIVKIYTDGGYSGGNINRPALQQMLKDIKAGSIDSVVVYKLDRLSRSQKDTLTLIEDSFLSQNVDFVSINENFDTSTPFGRAMIGILSVFAQLEKDQITERFTMGRIGRAKNGYFHGGAMPPVGYDYTDGHLIVNDYEALQVKVLYERFIKGYPLHDCWRYMQKNYTTKYGAWGSETLVRKVLKNRVYIGEVSYKGVHYRGIHKPIISDELYQRAQNVFEHAKRNLPDFRRSPFKATTLLSGLIYCGICGAKCHGEHGNYSCYSRTKGCPKYIVDPTCKNKKWKIPDLDNLAIDFVANLNFEEELEADHRNEEPKKDYSKRIHDIDKQISKLIDLYQVGSIPIDTISAKVNDLTREKEILESTESESSTPTMSIAEKLEFKRRFLNLLDDGPLHEKRACLANLIGRIVITDDNVEITLK